MAEIRCGAVVLAAGLSTRMGKQKLLLPWGRTTIIRAIIDVLEAVELIDRVIVLGSHSKLIETQLYGTNFKQVKNPNYKNGDMLLSIQYGIRALDPTVDYALIVLGDQPTITPELVNQLIGEASRTKKAIIIPSYNLRRGHPWLINRQIWNDILAIKSTGTLRDVINDHVNTIHYVITADPNILRDMDTPEAYQQLLADTWGLGTNGDAN